MGWRVERVKTFFEKLFKVGKKAGFTGENEELYTVRIRNFTLSGWENEGLRKATLGRKVPEMKPEQWTKAKSLYLAGKTWKAIASDLGLNQSTLLSKASREGLPKVRKELRNTVSSKENVSLESLSALVRSKLAADAASTLERVEGYVLEGIKDESVRETILASVAKRSALTFGWSETGEAPSVSVNILGALPDRNSVEVQVQGEPEIK